MRRVVAISGLHLAGLEDEPDCAESDEVPRFERLGLLRGEFDLPDPGGVLGRKGYQHPPAAHPAEQRVGARDRAALRFSREVNVRGSAGTGVVTPDGEFEFPIVIQRDHHSGEAAQQGRSAPMAHACRARRRADLRGADEGERVARGDPCFQTARHLAGGRRDDERLPHCR